MGSYRSLSQYFTTHAKHLLYPPNVEITPSSHQPIITGKHISKQFINMHRNYHVVKYRHAAANTSFRSPACSNAFQSTHLAHVIGSGESKRRAPICVGGYKKKKGAAPSRMFRNADYAEESSTLAPPSPSHFPPFPPHPPMYHGPEAQ